MKKQEEKAELKIYKLKLDIMEKEGAMGFPNRYPIVENAQYVRSNVSYESDW